MARKRDLGEAQLNMHMSYSRARNITIAKSALERLKCLALRQSLQDLCSVNSTVPILCQLRSGLRVVRSVNSECTGHILAE